MAEEKHYTLADFDFSKCKVVTSLTPEGEDESAILLRLVEGAGVALWRSRKDSPAELLPPRQDLFNYTGGYSWGYKGSGCQNLAYAIAGRVYEYDNLSSSELAEKTMKMLDVLISTLIQDNEYTLDVTMIRQSLGDTPREIF
ncbi:hypothetical protein VSW90_004379 [Salmonella enterica]|nr:hypothetical protein [Salmonella enterica]